MPFTALGGVKTLIKKMYIALKAEGFSYTILLNKELC
jgi:hypothetical protein